MTEQLQQFKEENKIYTKHASDQWTAWQGCQCEWDYYRYSDDPFACGDNEEEAVINICIIKGINVPSWMTV